MNWNCINYGVSCNDAIVIRDTFRCGVMLLASFWGVFIWGKLDGFTKRTKGETLEEMEHNRTIDRIEGMTWMFGMAAVCGTILSLIAWIIGKVFG